MEIVTFPILIEGRYFCPTSAITMRPLAYLLCAGLLAACNEPTGTSSTTDPAHTAGSTAHGDATSATSDRDSWQKPQEVFLLMGNDLRGRTIADLAAGDGYFTFKLIEVGANVIAMSDDPAQIAAIEARKADMKLSDERLRTRLVQPSDPGLAPGEVDACLLVHGYTRIPDKKAYLGKVLAGTKPPHPLFMVEWLSTETPIGPPMAERISNERIMDDIGLAGYTDVGTYAAKIPYQAFIFASVQSGADDDPTGMDPSQLMTQP